VNNGNMLRDWRGSKYEAEPLTEALRSAQAHRLAAKRARERGDGKRAAGHILAAELLNQ
jgi:hypothetical protein